MHGMRPTLLRSWPAWLSTLVYENELLAAY